MLRPVIAVIAVIASLRRLAERREGSVAMIFAICAIPIVVASGMAIDVGRAYAVKVRLGAALDAAALAIGSESSRTRTQMIADLQSYFTANYPSTALGADVSVAPVPADADLTAATVNFQAQATVPMTLMRLVGVDSMTVSVTAQTKKTTGLEVAVVLDNTGSMLCGPSDGAPSYSDSLCAGSVVAADTTCTDATNKSRICILRNAATQFVNTLTNAITATQQLYIGIVPYVTTVNVGNSLCASATSCSNITTEPLSGDFTDSRGNILPVTPITGNTTNGTTISGISPNTSAIYAGMQIAGTGIPSGATVSSVGSSTSITISSSATIVKTGNVLAIGPSAGAATAVQVFPPTVTGNWTNGSKTIPSVSPNTTGIAVGMPISGTGIPAGATVATIVSSTSITISANATSSQTGKTLTLNYVGNTVSGSATISAMGTTSNIVPGMSITGTGIPPGATVASIASSTNITISASATSTKTASALTITNLGVNTTSGSSTVSNITSSITPTVGMVVSGNGIPTNTAVQSFSGSFATGTGSITLYKNATATNNTALTFYKPITYDTTSTNTTSNWMGCVVEPTSSGENSSVSGVLNSAVTDPDYTEPDSWPSWYPLWWAPSSNNSWTTATVKAQSSTTETQGAVVAKWGSFTGPNQGCPAPLLPLTDVTDSSGKTQVLNSISSMWPRDAGGTQVHVGMIWGWRVLSPNGPFTPTDGHPLSYSDATTTGWKKAIVLMTDGAEEWPSSTHMTGLGFLADGKIGTASSTSTAVTNLGSRLASVCSNLAASGNYIIYTIGLGTDGAGNTQLQNCATTSNGGFFEAATTGSLQKVFDDIAKSLIALRLSQ